ncbi:hypothetical protein CXB51_014292 [Gossypium anomalum]|uniref:Plastid lipid-associated protein/fibrillin conserved domain-containing protein n=1 Tax=Gossypium anomalum TaxID=47600 RepID=A0A8J5YXE2_9ROSI|nr:hypothetical protein CXB51_014292 [Gossypium anomalum]
MAACSLTLSSSLPQPKPSFFGSKPSHLSLHSTSFALKSQCFRVSSSSVSISSRPADDLVASLLSKVIQTDGGVSLTTKQHQEVAQVANELNKYCVDEPVKCPLIFGDWDVIYCSNPTSPGGGYRSALGRLFFKTKDMLQAVEAPDSVRNKVSFSVFGFLDGEVSLKGKLKVLDHQWIQVIFEPPELRVGAMDFRYGGESEVKLQITYIDEKIRLGKGSRGGTEAQPTFETPYPMPIIANVMKHSKGQVEPTLGVGGITVLVVLPLLFGNGICCFGFSFKNVEGFPFQPQSPPDNVLKTSYGLDAISSCRIIKLVMTMATAVGISSYGVSLQWTNPNSYSSGKGCKYAGQSVRALPIRILTVGKKRLPGVQLLVDEYIAKLKSYCHVDDVQIRSNPKNARNAMAQVDDEDIAVINLITSNDWVVMLDERGLDLSSEQLAELLGDAGKTAASRLSFCIGGPYGHGKRVRKRANVSIKLSSMVLNHQIALVVLMEQIYRTKVPSLALISGQACCTGLQLHLSEHFGKMEMQISFWSKEGKK